MTLLSWGYKKYILNCLGVDYTCFSPKTCKALLNFLQRKITKHVASNSPGLYSLSQLCINRNNGAWCKCARFWIIETAHKYSPI